MRVQMIRVGAVLAAAIASVAFTIVKKGNDMSVTVQVKKAGGAFVDIADDGGKIRQFRDIDDFVKQASKLGLVTAASVIDWTVTNPGALEPALFTGDIIAKAQRTIASYTTAKTARETASGVLASEIALLPSGTAAEIAYKAEKQAQRDAVDALVTFYTDEIARLTALLP